jgi:hypothetical protein
MIWRERKREGTQIVEGEGDGLLESSLYRVKLKRERERERERDRLTWRVG